MTLDQCDLWRAKNIQAINGMVPGGRGEACFLDEYVVLQFLSVHFVGNNSTQFPQEELC